MESQMIKLILFIYRCIIFMITRCLVVPCIVANIDSVVVIRCKPPAEDKEIANLTRGDDRFQRPTSRSFWLH